MIVEKAFLGSLMKSGYLIKDTVIRPEHLLETRHKELLAVMMEKNQNGKGIDLISLSMVPNLESYGGISYLNDLLAHSDIEKFQEIETLILDSWKEREKKNILLRASSQDWEINRVISELDKINEARAEDHKSITEALAEMYEAPWQDQEWITTATTGVKKLNEMTRGFQDGEVTILAARPSMGKTDVMLHFAKSAGWAGYLPLIFSLEMPERLITSRLIAKV